MRTGIEHIPMPWVLVRCQTCHKAVAVWWADTYGRGSWHHHHAHPRRVCDRAVPLPEGTELDGLVAQGRRRKRQVTDRAKAPVTVHR